MKIALFNTKNLDKDRKNRTEFMANKRVISIAIQNQWNIVYKYFRYALEFLWFSVDNDFNHWRIELGHSRILLNFFGHKDFVLFLRIFTVMSDLYFQWLLNYGIYCSSDRTQRSAIIPGLQIQQWRCIDTHIHICIYRCVYPCGIKLKLTTSKFHTCFERQYRSVAV